MVRLRFVVLALCLGAVSVTLDAQQALRARVGSRSAPSTPVLTIHTPTTQGTWPQSSTSLTVAGTCVDDAACTSVSWTCTGCAGTTSGTATVSARAWSVPLTLTCSAGGTTNTFAATGTDGTLTSVQRTLVVTCTTPDGGGPTTAISSSSADVTSATYTLTGTCTDDIQCTRVQVTCSTCFPTDGDATMAGNGSTFSHVLALAVGNNTISARGYDGAGNSHQAQITVRYDPPLTIGTASLPSCTVSVACTLPAIQTSGGTGAVTFARTGGAAFPDNFAIAASTGVISGTCSATSTTVFTITATDSDTPVETDTQELTLRCVAAGAETAHAYYRYQIDNRSSCDANGDGTNCVLQINQCPHATYGDKGACSLRSQAQLYQMGSDNATAISDVSNPAGRRSWNYVVGSDTYVDPQDAARMILSGESWADCAGAKGGNGCQDPPTNQKLNANFADISTGTLTFVMDYWFGREWKSNGVLTESNCGGQQGNHKRMKHIRINSRAKGAYYWFPSKIDFEQDDQSRWFKTSASDAGLFYCDDDAIGLISGGGTGGGETTSTTQSLVTPAAIGVGDPDSYFNPSGRGAAWFENDQTYPLKAGKWTRIVGHVRFGVPANSAYLAPWRAGCDMADAVYRIETSSVNAGADTTISTGTFAHGFQVGNTVHIWGHEEAVPDINGFHTVTEVVSATSFKIGVDVTTAGRIGAVVKDTVNATDQLCADMLTTIAAQDADCATQGAANCGSLWNVFYVWIMDEDRAPQRINFAAPWHTMKTTELHKIYEVALQLDSSSVGCTGCGDRYIYHRNLFLLRNVPDADIADDGCSGKSCGDTGAVNSNLLRKPVR